MSDFIKKLEAPEGPRDFWYVFKRHRGAWYRIQMRPLLVSGGDGSLTKGRVYDDEATPVGAAREGYTTVSYAEWIDISRGGQ